MAARAFGPCDAEPLGEQAELDAAPDGLARHPGVHDLHVDGAADRITVRLEVDPAELGDVLSELTKLGVRSLTSRPPTLEELFLRHYEAS